MPKKQKKLSINENIARVTVAYVDGNLDAAYSLNQPNQERVKALARKIQTDRKSTRLNSSHQR